MKQIKIPKGIDEVKPLIMTEKAWRNSQLSVARFYGRIKFCGHEYWIVNKEGKDLFQCSAEAAKAGRDNVIEAGEPCDLCLKELIPVYRWMGREKILGLLKQKVQPSELIRMYNERADAK